jgi:hypothetical protein
MKHIRIILLVVSMIWMTTRESHAQFKLSGEFRPRAEYSHGFKTLAQDEQKASLFVSQRTRLNLDFLTEKLQTALVLQDVRNWGDQRQLVGNEDNAVSIHQAWLQYHFLPELAIKAGRQELVYDNSRIFGNVGWAQQGRSHDLLLIKYEGEFSLHAGLAYHQDADRSNNFYFGPDAYKSMQFIWANRTFDRLNVSLLFLNNGNPVPGDTTGTGPIEDQRISYSQTFGPVLKYSLTESVGINLEAYYQGGKDAGEIPLSAWYARIEGAIKLNRVDLTAGYEILSGTAYDETGKNHSFTPFYGTNHKFNGHMDYFYVGNHSNNVGLQDIFFTAKSGLGPLGLSAHLHMFLTAAQLSTNAGSYLGTELDLIFTWKIDDVFSLGAGYSHMLPGDSMQLLKGGSLDTFHNWAWLMLTVKPVFFKHELNTED